MFFLLFCMKQIWKQALWKRQQQKCLFDIYDEWVEKKLHCIHHHFYREFLQKTSQELFRTLTFKKKIGIGVGKCVKLLSLCVCLCVWEGTRHVFPQRLSAMWFGSRFRKWKFRWLCAQRTLRGFNVCVSVSECVCVCLIAADGEIWGARGWWECWWWLDTKGKRENDEEIKQDIMSTLQNRTFFPFENMNVWLQLKTLRPLQ